MKKAISLRLESETLEKLDAVSVNCGYNRTLIIEEGIQLLEYISIHGTMTGEDICQRFWRTRAVAQAFRTYRASKLKDGVR